MPQSLSLHALAGLPLVRPGDDLAALIAAALGQSDLTLETGDVLVVAQKIVSKAEGRFRALADVSPSARALELASITAKDPRLIELILSESAEVVRVKPGVIVVAHRLGFVMANAGIDHSNVEAAYGEGRVLLLPENPDASARWLRERLKILTGIAPKVIINDSFGRAWRLGTTGHAIGVAGFAPLKSEIGRPDLFGRILEATEIGVADELAAAASYVMGQAAEATPVVLIRGAGLADDEGAGIGSLLRPKAQDMFR